MAQETRPGTVIAERFRLDEALARGGFGIVWKARDLKLGIDVAVKEVYLPPASSPKEHADRLARAEREARNAAALRDHPHIVAVHDVITQDGRPWMVMRLVAGHSLEQHLAGRGPLPAATARHAARCLLQALDAAHAAGVVHRDVKPANVMVADDGEFLLTDFGIAVHSTDTSLTTTGSLIGSLEYVAPERTGGSDDRPAGDLFSLGATLYQAVAGVSPFRRANPTATLTALLTEAPPPLERAGRLGPLVSGLLEKDPARRLTVAGALKILDAPGKGAGPMTTSRAPTVTAPLPPPARTRRERAVPPPAAGGAWGRGPGSAPPPRGGRAPGRGAGWGTGSGAGSGFGSGPRSGPGPRWGPGTGQGPGPGSAGQAAGKAVAGALAVIVAVVVAVALSQHKDPSDSASDSSSTQSVSTGPGQPDDPATTPADPYTAPASQPAPTTFAPDPTTFSPEPDPTTYVPPPVPTTVPAPPPPPVRPDYYGAIAVAQNGSAGKSWDYRSRSAADQGALDRCPSVCKVLVDFVDGCGAVAYNPATNMYWGARGDTQAEAERNAIARAGGGHWTTWVCTAHY